MNVYSVQLIPQLKIKLCQLLGIASTASIEQLNERMNRVERAMDRFENQLRRLKRKQQKAPAKSQAFYENLKSNPAKSGQTQKARPAASLEQQKILQEVKHQLESAPSASMDKPAPKLAAVQEAISKKIIESSDVSALPQRPHVYLIQVDEATRATIQNYFGDDVHCKELASMNDLPAAIKNKEVLGVFFERSLVGQSQARDILLKLKEAHPLLPLVGIASYLTLALAKSIPGIEKLGTFLTRPITQASLREVFHPKEQAIS